MSFSFSEKRNSATNAALHRLITMAGEASADKSKPAWNIVLKGAMMAIQSGEYHFSIHQRFVNECPAQYKDIHFRIRKEIGQPDPKLGAPLRKGRTERKREKVTSRRVIETVAAISASA